MRAQVQISPEQVVFGRPDERRGILTLFLGEQLFESSQTHRGLARGLLAHEVRGRSGLVGRRVHPEVPPRVEYALTPLGATLAGPLRALGAWSVAHGKHVEEARGRFEERARAKAAA